MKKIRSRIGACLLLALFPVFVLAGPVNINTADAETLSAELQGVGLSRARAIVAYREAHGPFKRVEDLARVKGIGNRTLEINRDNILLEAPAGDKKKD